jgi:hypothetical protein
MLYDLSNSMTLSQEIITSLVFSVTESLISKEHKFDNIFLYVAF